MTILERYFLVGCPRSGTTLLQSLLAAHSQIHSFPESHFFANLLQRRKRWQKLLKLSSFQTNARVREFLKELEREDLVNRIPSNATFEWQHTKAFISILDLLTQEEKKSIWLEKTPGHLHYIEYIQRYIPAAKFIHITREGRDVVASMYEVTHKYPEIWGQARDIDTCIQRWFTDLKTSQSYANHPNHYLISYEQLVDDLEEQLMVLCDFLNIDFESDMLKGYKTVAQKVSLTSEPWKMSNKGTIKSKQSKKFFELFDEQERSYITDQIAACLK